VTSSNPRLGVVILGWGAEPYLGECVNAALESRGVDVELVLVDNGTLLGDLAAVEHLPGLRVLRPGRNTGFAGGCNLGAASTSAEYLALVNSDCIVAPDTLAALVAEAARAGIGPVMGSVRYAESPDVINSAGNPVHVLGVSWAGRIGEVEKRTAPYDVAAASGACLVVTRQLWDSLGGFDEEYFAYVEDTELSLRALRLGHQARCVPTAVALHHYEFSRNPAKMYLLERNRLMLLVTMWSGRALALLFPLLLALELGVLGQAAGQGWARQKIRGWWWLLTNRRHLVERRRLVRAEAAVPDQDWMRILTAQLDDQVIGSAAATRVVNGVVGFYWRVALRLL